LKLEDYFEISISDVPRSHNNNFSTNLAQLFQVGSIDKRRRQPIEAVEEGIDWSELFLSRAMAGL
jgi:hypothetical protein